MKTLIIFLSFLTCTTTTFAQLSKDTIVVVPGNTGMYFYHVLQNGETLGGLAEKYQVNKQQLAVLNQNQTRGAYDIVKIPLKKSRIVQTENASENSKLTPLYHEVSKGETLYRIGKIYGDIPLKTLKSWNHLTNNNIHVGQYLVVGWLQNSLLATSNQQEKTATPPAPVKKSASTTPPSAQAPPKARKSTDENSRFLHEVISAERQRVKNNPIESEPVSKPLLAQNGPSSGNPPLEKDKQRASNTVSKPLISSETPETSSKQPKKRQSHPENTTIKSKPAPSKQTPSPFEKMLNQVSGKSKKTPQSAPKESTPEAPKKIVALSTEKNKTPIKSEEGAPVVPNTISKTEPASAPQLSDKSLFSQLYQAQTQGEKLVNSKKGAAGWFKSNVKPGSKKYYALCNDLPRGTIVKVVNPINKNFVYVKVLAAIPKLKENYNLIIKLSDAAMEELGTSQPRFWSKIVYPRVSDSSQ